MINFEFAPWGIFFAGLMYVIGNGVWVNHVVRRKRWLGWVLWSLLGCLLLILAAAFDVRMGGSNASIMDRLTMVDPENHWIALTLFALLSVPGAACVLLKQSVRWTRLALLLPAMLIFLPMGQQLANPNNDYLLLSIGVTLAVCASLVLWQSLLDHEPFEQPRQHNKAPL
ncbi:MAG: hypothetical protein Q9M22_01690 [Mariprofundaceae bacterium]|nr:hypothetical protein [Mariprofundaceae bacterium]